MFHSTVECRKMMFFEKKLLLSTSGLECNPGFDLWVDGCFLPCPIGEYRYGYTCEKCYANCNVARLSLRSMGSQFLAAKGWMYCHLANLLPVVCTKSDHLCPCTTNYSEMG